MARHEDFEREPADMGLPDPFEEPNLDALDDDDPEELSAIAPETTELVTVMQAGNMREAKTMKTILESAEIPAFVGEEESGLVDEPGSTGLQGIPVLVPEEMAAEASEILADAAMDDEELDEDDELEDEWDDDDEEDDDYLDFDDDDLDEDEDDYDDDLDAFDDEF